MIEVPFKEFEELTEDARTEYINGRIYYLSSPTIRHQLVSRKIADLLENQLKERPCIIVQDCDIELDELKNNRTIVRPDISVLCEENEKIDLDERYKGTPKLIVEIVSPSNSSHDYVTKLDLYARAGVKEYIIVDPTNKTIAHYKLNEDNQYVHQSINEYELKLYITSNTVDFKEMII